MSPTPMPTAQRSPCPLLGSSLVRALRHTVVAAASLLLGTLGCASGPPDEPVAPEVPATAEAQPEQPADAEEWVHLPNRITFVGGSHTLDEQAQTSLQELHAELVARNDIIRVRVEGYSYRPDEPAAGLALLRAQAVIGYLCDELGMDRDVFEAVDRGDGRFGARSVGFDLFWRVEFSILVRRER